MSINEKRRELSATIPGWYSGYAHLAVVNVLALIALYQLLGMVEHYTAWLWLFCGGFFLFANGFEWWVHRGPMHHPTRFMRVLYRRHTLEHHVVFTKEDMAFREPAELYFILFPWWALPAAMIVNLPIPLVLGYAVSPDLGYLFYACTLAYYLVYEWLHTLHHVPPESWIGRRPVVGWLRTHHARHHDPARMTLGNFNVSFPLWDYLLGATLEPSSEGERHG